MNIIVHVRLDEVLIQTSLVAATRFTLEKYFFNYFLIDSPAYQLNANIKWEDISSVDFHRLERSLLIRLILNSPTFHDRIATLNEIWIKLARF